MCVCVCVCVCVIVENKEYFFLYFCKLPVRVLNI